MKKIIRIICALLLLCFCVETTLYAVSPSTNTALHEADINLYFDGKRLKGNSPIYISSNRYYIPISEIISSIGGYLIDFNRYICLVYKGKAVSLNIKENIYYLNKEEKMLKEPVLNISGIKYISLFDLSKIVGLKTRWDANGKSIYLFLNKDKAFNNNTDGNTAKPALIRLEDITPGNSYKEDKDLEKLRIVSDYLCSEHIPFYVAWTPRYMEPNHGIDINPQGNDTMYNADFVFTLDYLMDKGGIIGLHGYTHQYGMEESIAGREFHLAGSNDGIPEASSYIEGRIKSAKAAAESLNIPVAFFEAPHYAASPHAFKILEKNFDVIYEPYTPDGLHEMNKKTIKVKSDGRLVSYIPTPLNYVDGKDDTKRMLSKIDNLHDGILASFFYHPYIEFESISLPDAADEYPYYSYDAASPIHRIIEEFRKKGYKFTTINKLL